MGEKIWAEVIASAATVVSAWALWRTFVLERLVKGPRFWGWIREVRDEQWGLTVGASGELEAHSVTVASSAFVGQAVFGLIRGNGSALHKSVVVLSGENVPGDNMGRRFPALDIEYVDVGGYRRRVTINRRRGSSR
jgi:hypothetical protein